MTAKYQAMCIDKIGRNPNIPVVTSLQFFALSPDVTIVISDDRVKFIDRVLKVVRDAMAESFDGEIRVLYLCHLSLVEKMKLKLTTNERKRVIFSDPKYVLGCQFPVVILAIDLATISLSCRDVTDVMTRTTVNLKCIVNETYAACLLFAYVAKYESQ